MDNKVKSAQLSSAGLANKKFKKIRTADLPDPNQIVDQIAISPDTIFSQDPIVHLDPITQALSSAMEPSSGGGSSVGSTESYSTGGDFGNSWSLAQNTPKEPSPSSSIASSGAEVSNSALAMVLGGLALAGLAVGGGGGGSSSSTSSASSGTSGALADGYIANALVFRDVDNDAVWDHEVFVDNNNNGIYDTGDTFTDANGDGLFTAEAYAITDASGIFTGLTGTGKIVSTYLTDSNGSVLSKDISTGLSFTSTYAAPDGSTIVNPLTSLIAAQLSSSTATAAEISAAQTAVLSSFGITLPTGSSLLTYDPLAVSSSSTSSWETAVAIQKVAAQVANTIQVLAAAATGVDTSMASSTATMAALTALATTVSAGTTIDLSSATSISTVGTAMTSALVTSGTWTSTNAAAVSTQVTSASTSLASINTSISNISATSGSSSSVWATMASTQKVAQTTLATAIQEAAQGGSPVDSSAFSNTSLAALIETNTSAASVVLDMAPPVAPTIAGLATDSGTNTSDKITNTGTLVINNLETNATVQYSVNNGSFVRVLTLVQGENTVKVRQRDDAGNVSASSETFTFTYDTTAPTSPTVALGSGVDDGVTSTEAAQNSGVLTITAETGASTVVTFIKDGNTFLTKIVDGAGDTPVPVVLSADEAISLGYGAVEVSALATDAAGNASSAAATSLTFAAVSWATSFNEGALSSKLYMDVPNPALASVVLDTANQQLDFSAQGAYGMEAYYYRDDAPIVWTDLPEVQLGQSWSVQTRVSINDGLAEPQQSAGIAFYDADGGVPNFYFSLTKWIQPTYSLSDVAAVATQSGGGNGISGEAYTLLSANTSEVYLKVQVTELGLTDHYQFFYKGLLAQDPWIAVGDARTFTSKGNDSRVGLFYKTNQVTAGVTFDDFAITVPVGVAENSIGTVYTPNAIAEGGNTLSYALSGNDSALFSINPNTGELAFKAAPNFEEPLDDDGDNLYELTLTASDGVTTSVSQSVVIAVTNVVEQSAVDVTVAPAQLTEGDAGKLVYTFTRSSDLDGELTVNIGVAGTADTEDYSLSLQSQWTRLIGASRYSQVPPSAAVGADGAVYVSGRVDSTLLDGTNVLSESGGGYVRKFDADGSLVWTRLTDAVNDNYPYSVTTGVNGGVYVAGMAYNPAAYYDGFVTNFSSAGVLEWTTFVGGPDYDYIKSVSTDANGAIYVAGLSYDASWTASPFISRLDIDGNLEWTRPVASSDSPAISVSPTADGAVYVTGYSNSAILDGTTLLSNAGSFISKYDAVGNLKWTRLPDASGSSQTNSVSASADGAVYVAGYSYGNIQNGDVSQGGQDGFVSKFDADGKLVWTRLVSGPGNDSVKSVFTGADGAIYLAGETNSSLNGQVIQGAPNTTNGFVVKLDADDGALAWTHLIGGSNNELIKSVSADADGVVYIAGETYSSSLNGQNNQGNVAGFVSKIQPASLTQVTFATGSATATLTLKATSDTLIESEGNETVIVTVKPGQAYTVGSSASATSTIEDKLESNGNSVNINSRTDGNISVVGETDLYSIQLTEGEKYIFTLEANSSELNAGLNLFTTRSASNESLLLTNDNAFYLNNNARITYIAQETGTYYLQANGGIETVGDYVLSVSDSNVPTPQVEFQIPSPAYFSDATGDWTTEISWRSQEFYLYLDGDMRPTGLNTYGSPYWDAEDLPYWTSDTRSLLVNVELNGFGTVAELRSNIFDWGGRLAIQSGTSQALLPDTQYVYTIASGAIQNENGLTNDYYESTIFHTSADIIGPVAMKGGVATGTHAGGTYAYLTGFSSLDVATPGQTLSISTSPDTLFVQFNEPVRWPAGGWNQEWSAAASNGVIDGVYLVENDVRVYEFGVAYIPAWGNYEVGNIHLDLENKTGSDTSNNDEAIWLDLRNGFKSGGAPVGYTLKEDATYTLVFDVGMYDPMLNFSEPTTPPFEFSFIISPSLQVL